MLDNRDVESIISSDDKMPPLEGGSQDEVEEIQHMVMSW